MAIAYASAGTRTAANASSHDVAYPATVDAGDLLVLHVTVNGPSVTSATGWTEVYNETALSNPKGGVWYKIAAGTEGGTTTTITLSGAAATGAQIFRYTGVDGTTPLDGTPTNVTNTTAGVTTVLGSITTSGPTMLIYCNAGNSSSTTMSSTTGTERVDHGDLGSAKAGALYDEVVASSGATGTRTIDLSASRTNWGAMFALREAAAGGVDIAVPLGEITVTGYAPAIESSVNIAVPAGTITVDGVAPEANIGVNIEMPVGAITVDAPDPSVAIGSGIALMGTPTLGEGDSLSFNVSVPYPSGIEAGELLVAHIAFSQEFIGTTPPAGWTLMADHQNTTANTMSQAVFYRVADGSETGSVTFEGDPDELQDGRITGRMARWAGVDTTTPIDVANVEAGSGNSTSLEMPSITTVTNGALLIHQLTQNSTVPGISTSSGTTKFGTNVTGTGRDMNTYSELRPTAGATGTRTWTSTNNVQWGGITVALRPATAAEPVNIAVPLVQVTVSALAPDIGVGVSIDVPTGVVSVSVLAPEISVGVNLDVPTVNVATTGHDPSIHINALMDVPSVGITLTAHDPSVSVGVNLAIPTATITVDGHHPSITGSVNLDIPTGHVTVTGHDPAVVLGVGVSVPTGTVTLTGYAPSVSVGVNLSIPAASIVVAGQAPTVVLPSTTEVPTGVITVTGHAPMISVGVNLQMPSATITVDTWAPSVESNLSIDIPVAMITLTALAPHFTSGGRDLSFNITAVPIRPTTITHRDRHKRFVVYASAGERELVGAHLTEVAGQDISTCTFQIALGTPTQPGTWVTPDLNDMGNEPSERVLKLLVSSENATPGYYYVWIKVTDEVEIPLIRVPGIFLVR